MNSTQKPKLETAGPTATEPFFFHPADSNVGASYSGRLFTRYEYRTGLVGDWRELTNFSGSGRYNRKAHSPTSQAQKNSVKNREQVTIPVKFREKLGGSTNRVTAGRLFLECYLGRRLENWEVCRHGQSGPNDHSFTNIQVGDAVSNMIDDIETGKTRTSKTQLIANIARLERILLSRFTATQPTDA